ncbi:hypothetical protein GXP71_05610 [Cellulomonas sp. H30R-01]|uniref:hypothetical protein n=1 Tax=Cellulomonas sp. H30R-01 TaxID=2704467 RepID=UPI00138DC630|nr:hypothetical protein [Cellulomonas sp. H30R-01]QHT55615.1 hypothetical protein GXP71_05610 [Cellulomonas sp. H30R-01]
MSDEGLRGAGVTVGPDTLLVDGATSSVRAASSAAGLVAQDAGSYVRSVAEASTGGPPLSTVLVLLLLGFAGLVVPALTGTTLGLLGPVVPAVDLRVVGALSLAVVVIPLVGTPAIVARAERLGGTAAASTGDR